MREITTRVRAYTYPELSDAAKDRVREWWNRAQWEDGAAQESMQLLADGFLEDRGWEDVSDLSYSLYSPGGEPRWRGVLPAFTHDDVTYRATFTLRPLGGSSYAWEVTLDEDSELFPADGDEDRESVTYGTPAWDEYLKRYEAAEEAAKDRARSDSSELFYAMREEDEYIGSDESVSEACEANGYEFTEEGELI